ncbi:hypothetical protein BDQ17DRAFT_1438483 [Cyathus striatus]|nr:hypothetical protein BDQ17DRAFT_1438483 [Cyathus striatus]
MAPRSLRSATAAASSIPATSTRSRTKGSGTADTTKPQASTSKSKRGGPAKKSSVQRLKEDQQNEAAGKPKRFTKNSNISVAPPPHYREHSGTVTPASIL